MLTSLAPSPIANRGALVLRFTSLTTRAFCNGETRPVDLLASYTLSQSLTANNSLIMGDISSQIKLIHLSYLAHDR